MPEERVVETSLQRVFDLEQLLAAQAKLLDAVDEGIIQNGPNRCVTFWNRGAETIFGWSAAEMMGRPAFQVLQARPLDGRGIEELSRVVDNGSYAGEMSCVRKNGETVIIDLSVVAWRGRGEERKGSIATVRDASLRKRAESELVASYDELEHRVAARTSELASMNAALQREIEERKHAEKALSRSEEQLRHAQKMDAVGRLAGGIAHDFNNMLSVILSYSAMSIGQLAPDAPLRADISEIHKAGMRAAELTSQLLAFSRQQVTAPKIVDLNATIAEMDRMLRRVLGENIEQRTLPAAGLWQVEVDPSQIDQVVVNLALNARDAMSAGGRLTIETANVALDENFALDHLGVLPGPYVMLAVSDTGMGIDKPTQARIFDPFFTTKEQGKGTGLGLSTVFGIVRQSGGTIWVYSEIGTGTTFKVYLPRVMAPGVRATTTETPPLVRLAQERTILLVEDEPQVRVLAHTILSRMGYVVLDAHDGPSAVALGETYEGDIHLLLTDVVMPGMNGRELADRIRPTRPHMKVLFMSGYTGNVVVHSGVLDGGVEFLQKPLTPTSLLRKVAEVLNGAVAERPLV